MRNEELKHFLVFYLKCIINAKELMACRLINNFGDHMEYVSTDRYPIPVDIKWNYDPDAYAVQFDFDLCGLPSEFSIETMCFDTKDTLFSVYNSRTKMEVELDYSNWLTEETFFQQSLIHNIGNTDLQYWKDCMELLEKIQKEMTNV